MLVEEREEPPVPRFRSHTGKGYTIKGIVKDRMKEGFVKDILEKVILLMV